MIPFRCRMKRPLKWLLIALDFFTRDQALNPKIMLVFLLLSISSSAMEQGRQKFLDRAINLAMKYRQIDYTKFLLEHGAKLDVQEERQLFLDEAIEIAMQSEQMDFIELLLKDGADRDKALVYASRNGFKELVAYFLRTGVNIDGTEGNKPTPLMAASWNGQTETVKFLLECRANVNGTNRSGMTALISAAQVGKIEIFNMLLAHGADINAEYSNGSKALGFAAQCGCLEIAKILVKLGADPTEINRDNNTPIYYASMGSSSTEEERKDMIKFIQSLEPQLEEMIILKGLDKVYFKATLIFNLSRELWSKIIGYVSPNISHLIHLRYVCKNFYNACLDIDPKFIDMDGSAYKDKYNYCVKAIYCDPENLLDK
jgi:ankyrin repeat protein